MPMQSADTQSQPLYAIKANLFKALSHPARIRVLEILSSSEHATPVSEMLAITDIEPTLLSQHLAVLKRHQVITGRRIGNRVFYELANPKIAELLVIARTFLADMLGAQRDQFDAIASLPPLSRSDAARR